LTVVVEILNEGLISASRREIGPGILSVKMNFIKIGADKEAQLIYITKHTSASRSLSLLS
jgi:hypothetical protein